MEAGIPAEKIAIADSGGAEESDFPERDRLDQRPARPRPLLGRAWEAASRTISSLSPGRPIIMTTPAPTWPRSGLCLMVKDKTKLNILVMLTPLYHNIGPRGFSEKYLWPYKGLIVGQDAVAVDSTGLPDHPGPAAEGIRRGPPARDVGPPYRPGGHEAQARQRAIPSQIELIKLGWQTEMLI